MPLRKFIAVKGLGAAIIFIKNRDADEYRATLCPATDK